MHARRRSYRAAEQDLERPAATFKDQVLACGGREHKRIIPRFWRRACRTRKVLRHTRHCPYVPAGYAMQRTGGHWWHRAREDTLYKAQAA